METIMDECLLKLFSGITEKNFASYGPLRFAALRGEPTGAKAIIDDGLFD